MTVVERPDKTSPKAKLPGVELHFPERPSREVRQDMIARGFRLARNGPRRWYAYATPERRALVDKLVAMGDAIEADTLPLTAKPPKRRRRKRLEPVMPPEDL